MSGFDYPSVKSAHEWFPIRVALECAAVTAAPEDSPGDGGCVCEILNKGMTLKVMREEPAMDG